MYVNDKLINMLRNEKFFLDMTINDIIKIIEDGDFILGHFHYIMNVLNSNKDKLSYEESSAIEFEILEAVKSSLLDDDLRSMNMKLNYSGITLYDRDSELFISSSEKVVRVKKLGLKQIETPNYSVTDEEKLMATLVKNYLEKKSVKNLNKILEVRKVTPRSVIEYIGIYCRAKREYNEEYLKQLEKRIRKEELRISLYKSNTEAYYESKENYFEYILSLKTLKKLEDLGWKVNITY